ncbi:hypothetical protein CERSUDRAFT_127429 [Gelatoporia subvermispora B]|uniref:Uncharacterized protein n=1 Tax=Ceriporiopsis subvermispora (strain B) TaxID=914234 RepID=M2P7X5_CERS8|nr:hypothetical protein CERSUDRAFT_127429 [Gelatoporia subvermispora B]
MVTALDNTLGALLLGYFVAAVLFGITSLQTWTYFRDHPKDHVLLRILVFFLWVLDCLHVVLLTNGVYFDLVTSFGNLVAVSKPHWSYSTLPLVTCIITLTVRGVWKMSKGMIVIPIAIAAGSLYVLGDATYFGVRELFVENWSDSHQFSWSLYAGFGCEIVVDVAITVLQYVYLRKFQSGASFGSINTCLVTSLKKILAKPIHATCGPATEFATLSSLEAASNPDKPLPVDSPLTNARHLNGKNERDWSAYRSASDII